MDINSLRKKRDKLHKKAQDTIDSMHGLAMESDRVAGIAENADVVLSEIDAEFERITALNKVDFTFVLFASMLQSLRWILMPELKLMKFEELNPEVTKEERLRANEKNHHGGIYAGKSSGAEYELNELEKYREKHQEWARKTQTDFYKRRNKFRSWIEILTQPVPYDAMNALDKKSVPNIANLNLQDSKGLYSNIYGKNHHVATLGHDPVLGWFFGTANIMTSTISFVDFQNYEVRRGHKIKSLGEFVESRELQFSDQIIDYLSPRGIFDILGECISSTKEDYKRVAAAVVRQAIHFASDLYCVEGLPIPIISVIDPQEAQELIEEGWNSVEFERIVNSDLKQIGISAALSVFINLIVEAIYLFCYKCDYDQNIRRVKVKRILSLADILASSSNVLYVAITQNIAKVDIGGIGATMLTLLNSTDFTCKVKQEYIKSNFERLILC